MAREAARSAADRVCFRPSRFVGFLLSGCGDQGCCCRQPQHRVSWGMWFEHAWDKERQTNKKLVFYNQVKPNFCSEPYLNMQLTYNQSKRTSQIRSSAHRINIEAGRYGANKDELLSRVCPSCTANSEETLDLLSYLPMFNPVKEDEMHVITTCVNYLAQGV